MDSISLKNEHLSNIILPYVYSDTGDVIALIPTEDIEKTQNGERIDFVNDGLSLIQNDRYFCFGTDALLLASFIRGRSSDKAAELGCGTGIISLLLLQRNKAHEIDAMEIQPYFAELANRNAALNGFSDRLHIHNMDIRDRSERIQEGSYSYCFSNPPYFPEHSGLTSESPETDASRRERNGTIDDFCACAERLTKYGGFFFLVHRPDRLPDVLCALRSHHLEPKRLVFIQPDYDKSPSLFLVEARHGGSPGSLNVLPPLILSEYPSAADVSEPYASYFNRSTDNCKRKER